MYFSSLTAIPIPAIISFPAVAIHILIPASIPVIPFVCFAEITPWNARFIAESFFVISGDTINRGWDTVWPYGIPRAFIIPRTEPSAVPIPPPITAVEEYVETNVGYEVNSGAGIRP